MTITDGTVTWERSRMTRNPNGHPEWSAGIWSAARAALLSTRVKPRARSRRRQGQQPHGPRRRSPRAARQHRRLQHRLLHGHNPRRLAPCNGEPGDYKLKGMSPGIVTAPSTWEEYRAVRALSRSHLKEQQSGLT
ncbi:hypothetical protein [Streptomyces globisporus]|uniref:hypothetical protein n=1 Tax=Streptomyces globisporus TaxID=1908 RepID=UPI001F1BE361|nr:hypothetical protein [Streptomyces globisporus]